MQEANHVEGFIEFQTAAFNGRIIFDSEAALLDALEKAARAYEHRSSRWKNGDWIELLCARYGLRGMPVATRRECADRFDISITRVQQIQNNAMRMLRDYLGNGIEF